MPQLLQNECVPNHYQIVSEEQSYTWLKIRKHSFHSHGHKGEDQKPRKVLMKTQAFLGVFNTNQSKDKIKLKVKMKDFTFSENPAMWVFLCIFRTACRQQFGKRWKTLFLSKVVPTFMRTAALKQWVFIEDTLKSASFVYKLQPLRKSLLKCCGLLSWGTVVFVFVFVFFYFPTCYAEFFTLWNVKLVIARWAESMPT